MFSGFDKINCLKSSNIWHYLSQHFHHLHFTVLEFVFLDVTFDTENKVFVERNICLIYNNILNANIFIYIKT